MRKLLIATLLLALAGCSPTPTTPPALAPLPAPATTLATTTPQLRADKYSADRHPRILANVRQGGHEICFLGASIIERWETVGKDDWNAVWLPRHAVDCGISGDRTQHVLARFDDGLLDSLAAPNNHIKWIVINIGSNNLEPDTPADIAAGIEAILARLTQKLPDARIALSAVFPRGQHPNPLRDKAAQTNALLTAYLATNDPSHRVHFFDVGHLFLTPEGDIPADLMPDFLHPSVRGYQLWSAELEKIVR
ncbi:MAG: GDSL-type esterase/lipase family protein [Phycisphaerales bacterium]